MKRTEKIIEIFEKRIEKNISIIFDISRTQALGLINGENIEVNGEVIDRKYNLKVGDEVTISFPSDESDKLLFQDYPLKVIHEDENIIVIDKDQGVVVHPSETANKNTLVNYVLFHAKDFMLNEFNTHRPGIVHRIDKDTTGVIVVAKNKKSYDFLTKQWEEKKPTREYTALVEGLVTHRTGTIDAPIGRNPSNRKEFIVTNSNSKESITHFEVIKWFEKHTLVKCKLETGRTHQIRVHFKFIGHPIVGDPIYGFKKSIYKDGQLLHANKLGIIDPKTNEYIEFNSDIHKSFKNVIESLNELDLD